MGSARAMTWGQGREKRKRKVERRTISIFAKGMKAAGRRA
jgi:hypothetical protein